MDLDRHFEKFALVRPDEAFQQRVLEACRQRRSVSKWRGVRRWATAAAVVILVFATNQWLERRMERLFVRPARSAPQWAPVPSMDDGEGLLVISIRARAFAGTPRTRLVKESWFVLRGTLMESKRWE